MKLPVSCKNRLAIKTMKCEKKLLKSHIILKLEKCVEKDATSTH